MVSIALSCAYLYSDPILNMIILSSSQESQSQELGGTIMRQGYTYLGTPLQIGRLTVKNRFCMAPIGGGQHHLPGGGLKNKTIQYLVERAKGGFGLIFTGTIAADGTVDPYTGVGPTILQNPDAFKLTATELNERAGSYGTKIFAQITMGLGRNYPNLPAPLLRTCIPPSRRSLAGADQGANQVKN